MALTNFTLPFGGISAPNWGATISPIQTHHATAVNNLLYGPAGHQETDAAPPPGVSHQDFFKNNPYAPPQNHQYRSKPNNNYLPPSPTQPPYSQQQQTQHQQQQQQQQQQQHHQQNRGQDYTQRTHHEQRYNQHATFTSSQTSRTYGEGGYSQVPTQTGSVQQTSQYYNAYNSQTRTYNAPQPQLPEEPPREVIPPPDVQVPTNIGSVGSRESDTSSGSGNADLATGKVDQTDSQGYPIRPPGFTRVQAGQGSRTQVHAVLDYDADENEEGDYYDTRDPSGSSDGGQKPTVTPIQGPIFVKNGTVPVVPLFSYPTINNGTFVQIPIWWTALSVALGLDIRGDIIRGVPCVKRYHQLFCPTAGNSYPIDKIERFIDDNKALMRRMYGDFEMSSPYGPSGGLNKKRKRRRTDEPDEIDLFGAPETLSHPMDQFEIEPDSEPGESYFGKYRKKRQSIRNPINNPPPRRNQKQTRGPEAPGNANQSDTGRIDACESKIEIVTPYWASNSAGKIRAIVNTQHFEQAIHQEICTKKQTGRCGNDCGCEQKYKWHRLLAYDPDNDCKGIFMDWFLFPSCCVCRCNPS